MNLGGWAIIRQQIKNTKNSKVTYPGKSTDANVNCLINSE